MTGALYIPGADRTSRWFYDDFPNAAMAAIDKTLLHSTETQKSSGCPGYAGGSTAPQVTINPWPGYQKTWQHFPIIRPGRALGNPSSTPVSENKDNVFQVEIIGFSDPALGRRYNCYLPELPDAGLDYLAKMLAFVHEQWPHPLTIPPTWPLYKVSSYAAMDAAHMSSSQYDRFEGILAHLHAPKPSSHGDVAINIRGLVSRVNLILNPPPPPEPPVAVNLVPSAAKEATMYTLVRVTGGDAVFLSDLITRRWIASRAELAAVQAQLKARGVTDVTVREVDDLTPYGVLVGPVNPKP